MCSRRILSDGDHVTDGNYHPGRWIDVIVAGGWKPPASIYKPAERVFCGSLRILCDGFHVSDGEFLVCFLFLSGKIIFDKHNDQQESYN
jgi:hypothetical protein